MRQMYHFLYHGCDNCYNDHSIPGASHYQAHRSKQMTSIYTMNKIHNHSHKQLYTNCSESISVVCEMIALG